VHCQRRSWGASAVPSQFAVGSKIIAEEGVGALYRGLSAGLLRQATYTTARLGIYQFISDELAKRHDGKVPTAAAQRCKLLSAASHAAHVVSLATLLPPESIGKSRTSQGVSVE